MYGASGWFGFDCMRQSLHVCTCCVAMQYALPPLTTGALCLEPGRGFFAKFVKSLDPLRYLDRGRWSDCPGYVRHTAPLSRESVRALASFRLGVHDLDVETAKFQSRSAVGTLHYR
jgi:hypothetical protein